MIVNRDVDAYTKTRIN